MYQNFPLYTEISENLNPIQRTLREPFGRLRKLRLPTRSEGKKPRWPELAGEPVKHVCRRRTIQPTMRLMSRQSKKRCRPASSPVVIPA